MNPDSFDQALRRLKHQHPFKPFVLNLTDGRQITIDDPDGLAFCEGGGAFIQADGFIHFFDCDLVNSLPDAADSAAA